MSFAECLLPERALVVGYLRGVFPSVHTGQGRRYIRVQSTEEWIDTRAMFGHHLLTQWIVRSRFAAPCTPDDRGRLELIARRTIRLRRPGDREQIAALEDGQQIADDLLTVVPGQLGVRQRELVVAQECAPIGAVTTEVQVLPSTAF